MKLLSKLEQYRWPIIAIVGTLVVHLLFLSVLGNTEMKTGNIINKVTIDFAAEIDEVIQEEEIIDPNEMQVNPLTGELENRTITSNEKSQKSNQNFSAAEIEAELAAEYKALEAGFNNSESKTAKAKAEYEAKLKALKQKNDKLHDDKSKNEKYVDGGEDAGAVTMDFSVKGRTILHPEKPSYLCIKSGTVFMNIKVRQNGVVYDAKINEGKTNTSNACLINRAIEYAKKCKFNEDFSAPRSQEGFIKYTYSAQ